MPGELPHAFETIVVRDCWQWQHLDVSLLSEDDQYRLMRMPSFDTLSPFGVDWANYANETAQSLESERRWLAAQAYWFASAQLLIQENQQQSEAFSEALKGIVRTGRCSAGMPTTTQEIDELADDGLQILLVPVQKATLYSLLLVGTLQNSIYDDLHLSNPARIHLSSLLSPILGHQKTKGSHNLFEEAVRAYTEHVSQIKTSVDVITNKSTLDSVKGQRNKLIEKLHHLASFVLDSERILISKIQLLLSSELSTYLKAQDDAVEEAYTAFKQSVQGIIEEAQVLDAYVSSCILLPLILSVERAVSTHYTATIHSRLPELKLKLLKPEARSAGNTSLLEIKVENEGVDAARDCALHLEPQGQSHVSFESSTIQFGTVETGSANIATCLLYCSSDISVISLKCLLEWRDRAGPHRRPEILKVERQHKLDWDELIYAAPYGIQSITEPTKLKGRDDQLRELLLGFFSKGSFMITGQKRVGKTSIVNVLLAELRNRDNVLPLYVPIGELSAASGDDLGRLGQELIKRLVEEYTDFFHVPMDISIPSLEEFRDAFNDSFARCIRQITRKYPVQIAFALDDFDELPTPLFTGSIGRTLFLALRALINSGTSFFFIGSERLPTIMKEQAERLNQVKTLKVDYLDREALEALVREPVRGQLEYTKEALAEIEIWSAGNPYFATLICGSVWERALEKRDYWVTEDDVKGAINDFAKKSTRNSYEHFWSDSPLADDESRYIYETRSSYVLLALSQLQPDPITYTNRRDVINHCEGLNRNEADLHLQELINYNVVETHAQDTSLVRIRVPLFTGWLQAEGAKELRQDEMMKRRFKAGVTRNEELSASEVIAVTTGLSYRGYPISTDEVRVWASQFGHLDDQRLMLKLLQRLRDQGLYTEGKITHALSQMQEMILQRARERRFLIHVGAGTRRPLQNVFVTHADPTGKSGSALVTQYRNRNSVLERLCGGPDKVFSAIGKNASVRAILVFLDDFIGSGQSAVTQLEKLNPRLQHYIPDWQERVLVIYATIVGFEKGIKFIEERIPSETIVFSYQILTEADKAFSPENNIFETAEERKRALDIAHKIGSIFP